MKKIRIACRDNLLAVERAQMVIQAIREYDPLIAPELIRCQTPADQFSYLPKLPPSLQSAHLPVLEEQLRLDKADLVVHSLKELPFDDPPDFPLMAVGRRLEPGYALVLPTRSAEPDFNLPVGISEQKQQAILADLYPSWETELINGELETRLSLLESGRYSGLILSAASLIILRRQERVYRMFPVHQMIPSCCQGMVAVQGRAGESAGFLAGFHSVDAWDMALAERAFGKAIGGERIEPLFAALATVKKDQLTIRGLLMNQAGKRWDGMLSGRREDAVSIGAALAARLSMEAAGPRSGKSR